MPIYINTSIVTSDIKRVSKSTFQPPFETVAYMHTTSIPFRPSIRMKTITNASTTTSTSIPFQPSMRTIAITKTPTTASTRFISTYIRRTNTHPKKRTTTKATYQSTSIKTKTYTRKYERQTTSIPFRFSMRTIAITKVPTTASTHFISTYAQVANTHPKRTTATIAFTQPSTTTISESAMYTTDVSVRTISTLKTSAPTTNKVADEEKIVNRIGNPDTNSDYF